MLIGLIPARSGSKRLPGKNLLQVGGRSLVARAVETATNAGLDMVIVSSDSDAILKASGAPHLVKRPPELSTDDASTIDACLHACQEYADTDTLVLLQPTSPFRSAETIRKAVALHQEKRGPVVAVSRLGGNEMQHCYTAEGMLKPAEVVRPNGCVYVVNLGFLRLYRSFTLTASPLFIEGNEALDIDTLTDLTRAREIAGDLVPCGELKPV